MQGRFYADARDEIKWSLVSRLARDGGIHRVIQVAMVPQSTRREPKLVQEHVRRFFQSEREELQPLWNGCLRRAERLGQVPPNRYEIKVLDQPFAVRDRETYFREICELLETYPEAVLVLLDPDTGMEPPKHTTAAHVTKTEIGRVFNSMPSGSVLVVYQHHTHRPGFVGTAQSKFEDALPEDAVKDRPVRDGDVAFLVAHKRA